MADGDKPVKRALARDDAGAEHPSSDVMVDHPPHYTSGPACERCGNTIECITVIRDRHYGVAAAMKYLWRLGLKHSAGLSDLEKEIQDLEKARWYLADEVAQRRRKLAKLKQAGIAA